MSVWCRLAERWQSASSTGGPQPRAPRLPCRSSGWGAVGKGRPSGAGVSESIQRRGAGGSPPSQPGEGVVWPCLWAACAYRLGWASCPFQAGHRVALSGLFGIQQEHRRPSCEAWTALRSQGPPPLSSLLLSLKVCAQRCLSPAPGEPAVSPHLREPGHREPWEGLVVRLAEDMLCARPLLGAS